MAFIMPAPASQKQGRQNRERQKTVRRDAILAAARSVFAEKGYEGATIADIAREAGVASGTVYLYYASKTDLFAALNGRLFEVIGEALLKAEVHPDVRENTRERINGVFAACGEYRDLVRLVFLNPDPRSEVARRRVQSADDARLRPLAELIKTGIDAGVVRKGDPAFLARIINGLVISALYQCFVLSDGRDVQVYEGVVTDMIVGALAPA